MLRTVLAVLVIGITTQIQAQSVDWKEVFPVRKHNFGTVAVAAKTEFRFPVKNESAQTIHIRKVRASCGCTTPIVESSTIAPGDTSYIRARFNTDTFKGKRGANLTVVIDRPVYTEVRLRVDGYIRSDIVFHPGAVEFGAITATEGLRKTVKVMYAGRKNWTIKDVESPQSWLKTSFAETGSSRTKKNYLVTVEIAEDAPAGFFQDELIVHTNDSAMPRVPLRVSGEIASLLKVSPGVVALGKINAGESVTKKIVIVGQKPFKISSLSAAGFEVKADLKSESRKTHIVQATFTPDAESNGATKGDLVITTGGEESTSASALITAEIAGN